MLLLLRRAPTRPAPGAPARCVPRIDAGGPRRRSVTLRWPASVAPGVQPDVQVHQASTRTAPCRVASARLPHPFVGLFAGRCQATLGAPPSRLSSRSRMGELSALACAVLWAASTVAMRSQTARVPALAINAF